MPDTRPPLLSWQNLSHAPDRDTQFWVGCGAVLEWGKLTVRNDRGDRGNVGIIRSPIRASILPDHLSVPHAAQLGPDVHRRARGHSCRFCR